MALVVWVLRILLKTTSNFDQVMVSTASRNISKVLLDKNFDLLSPIGFLTALCAASWCAGIKNSFLRLSNFKPSGTYIFELLCLSLLD